MSAFISYCGLAVAVALMMLGLPRFLGERHRASAMLEPYESGMIATGTARIRMSVDYYLIALFFVLFDVEVALLLPWALVVRDGGWEAYFAVWIFTAVLLAALLYLARSGAFRQGGGA